MEVACAAVFEGYVGYVGDPQLVGPGGMKAAHEALPLMVAVVGVRRAARLRPCQHKAAAAALGLNMPSLVMMRFEDAQQAVYKGEPDVDEMFIWTQHFSIPQFRNLELKDLFSPDGVSVKSAIAFLDMNDGNQVDTVFPAIGKYASLQNWIKFYYAFFSI